MSNKSSDPHFGAAKISPYGIRTSPYYSSVTHSNGPCTIVTLAGQIGARPDGSVPSDPVEQYKLAISNLGRCLEAAGARVQDILKLNYYIVNFDSKNPRHRPILMDFLGDHRPASTLIPVEQLAAPEFLFEIEATAAIPQYATERVDVVVVGAGLSGLQAAVDLHKAGKTVKVLEARDRVGGKTWSRSAQASVCDVGAAWINDTNQSKMYALARKCELNSFSLPSATVPMLTGCRWIVTDNPKYRWQHYLRRRHWKPQIPSLRPIACQCNRQSSD